MIYAGIGSRKAPKEVLQRFRLLGAHFAYVGFTLRSGAAPGCDQAFERGCDAIDGPKEIFLPWKGFNDHSSELFEIPELAFEIAADVYGPTWKHTKRTTRVFMARDVQQVLGKNLDAPSNFVVCWTPDGCNTKKQRTKKTGGTGQAIACASERNIPVFNLQRDGDEDRLVQFLEIM